MLDGAFLSEGSEYLSGYECDMNTYTENFFDDVDYIGAPLFYGNGLECFDVDNEPGLIRIKCKTPSCSPTTTLNSATC